MFNLFDKIDSAPLIRPMINIGCLCDIQTGDYHIGEHGESILNGGVPHMTGVGGRGNMFKSVIEFFMGLMIIDRCSLSSGIVYDSEMTASMNRMHGLAANMPNIGGQDLVAMRRLKMTDNTMYSGNGFYDLVKETQKEKANHKEAMGTTPFLDKDGNRIKALIPSVIMIDSFSQFRTDSVTKIQDKAAIGESDRNMEAMRDAHAKNQMLMELPMLSAKYGGYWLMTAHMGDDVQMDPYAPPKKKLAFLKNNIKFKNVPEKFTFLMNNCWYAMSSVLLVNQTTKAPEFPRDKDDDLKGDTDLMLITLMNLRGKSGRTGLPFELIVSQSEGVKVGLTEFNYIKQFERYGLGGNDRNYFLELVPDVNLSRTTIRGKIDENVEIQRALEITSEMCQMQNLWHDLPAGLLCTPKELYEDLKAKGFDWKRLLATRGYWVFKEDPNPLPFLSTMDLLNMRAGTYRPYWY